MDREKIEQEFRAAEDYAKVRRISRAAMYLFLQDLQELEKDNEDITKTVQNVINNVRLAPNCDMKPITVYIEVVKIVDPSKISHFWAD